MTKTLRQGQQFFIGKFAWTGKLLTLLLFEENTVLKKNRRHIEPTVRFQMCPIPSLKHPLAPNSPPCPPVDIVTTVLAASPAWSLRSSLIPAHARFVESYQKKISSLILDKLLSLLPNHYYQPKKESSKLRVFSCSDHQEAQSPVCSLIFAAV